MKETRFKYGLLWKLGKVKGAGFEEYYNEFKDEIDKSIKGMPTKKKIDPESD